MHGVLTGLAFALAAVLCWRLLRAGRLQLRGKLPQARALARQAGMGAAVACAALALLLCAQGRAGALAAAGAALGAGACALLGGLSGKPVPAAWFAEALLGASLVLLTAC